MGQDSGTSTTWQLVAAHDPEELDRMLKSEIDKKRCSYSGEARVCAHDGGHDQVMAHQDAKEARLLLAKSDPGTVLLMMSACMRRRGIGSGAWTGRNGETRRSRE
jgi:hypothetical protein